MSHGKGHTPPGKPYGKYSAESALVFYLVFFSPQIKQDEKTELILSFLLIIQEEQQQTKQNKTKTRL